MLGSVQSWVHRKVQLNLHQPEDIKLSKQLEGNWLVEGRKESIEHIQVRNEWQLKEGCQSRRKNLIRLIQYNQLNK